MKSIKLVGIKGDRSYEFWKERIGEVMPAFDYDLEIEEVNSIEEIIHLKLESIPAILINGVPVLQQNDHLPDNEEIHLAIEDFLIKKRKRMKKIIVPTDFSQTAQTAFLYAEALSGKLGNPIKVVNISHPSTDSLDGVTAPMMDDLLKMKAEKLEKFVHVEQPVSGNSSTDVLIETEAIPGFAKSEIVEISKSDDTEMIVMGTTGERGVLIDILGSISSGVSQQAKCPVWLIPPGAKFTGINNILYASNFESADDTIVMKAANLASQFGSMIHFVHVNEKNESEDFTETEGKIFDRLFSKGEPSFPFQMKAVSADSVAEGINGYAENENVDLVVIVNRQRSFWESLTGQSMTKNLTLAIKKPTLVYHLEK